EATQAEIDKYGTNLNIWQQLQLLSAWSPLIGYGQRFINELDPYKKSLIVGEACEWLAAKTQSVADDQFVRLLADVLRTPQGEAMVRFLVLQVEGRK
ncbi:MAG: hypothetical protein EBZ69_10260, partial [Alphaproteobacteria bacterium]|nr:hypothetical protein [Alphaproteobacteria bacterium]